MKCQREVPLRRSVFTKLLAVLLLSGMAINLVVILFFGAVRHKATDSYNGHLLRYVDYLIADMDQPPDLARARAIADQTGMVIRFQSETVDWATGAKPKGQFPKKYHVWYQDDRIEAGSWHGSHWVRVKNPEGLYTFSLPFSAKFETQIKFLGTLLLLLISLIMLTALVIMRRIMRPLKWLQTGVEKVSAGDLDHRVPYRARDELRSLAQAFNTMTERLKHLLKTKDRLLVDVSHELRSPITRMKVALEFLADHPSKDNIAEDLVEMETMVTDILNAARAQNSKATLDPEPTDMGQLIADLAQTLAAAPPGITLNPLQTRVILSVDPRQIRTCLKNIIENAQKYSAHQAQPVEITLSLTPEIFKVRVKDHGIGIPPQDLDHICDPFYRVDRSRTRKTGGFGLGLSICQHIIDAHAGQINIQSQPDQGTWVEIELPRTQPNNAAPA